MKEVEETANLNSHRSVWHCLIYMNAQIDLEMSFVSYKDVQDVSLLLQHLLCVMARSRTCCVTDLERDWR
jgi:hypothetical protein